MTRELTLLHAAVLRDSIRCCDDLLAAVLVDFGVALGGHSVVVVSVGNGDFLGMGPVFSTIFGTVFGTIFGIVFSPVFGPVFGTVFCWVNRYLVDLPFVDRLLRCLHPDT